MKIQIKVTIGAIILLVTIGAIFLVEYNKNKTMGFTIGENNTEVDLQLESSEINVQDNTFLNLINEQQDISIAEKILIIGGGYEFFRDGGSYKKCISWGNAYCEETELVCPNGYDKLLSGKYKEKPESNNNLEQWFLCADNSTIKTNVTSKSSSSEEIFSSRSPEIFSSGSEGGGLIETTISG